MYCYSANYFICFDSGVKRQSSKKARQEPTTSSKLDDLEGSEIEETSTLADSQPSTRYV